jgi:hypothetical protein
MRLNDLLNASGRPDANVLNVSGGVLDWFYNSLEQMQNSRGDAIIVEKGKSGTPQGDELAQRYSGIVVASFVGPSV